MPSNIVKPVKDSTIRRNRLVLINYCRVIKQYGADAAHMSRRHLYELAAEPFININGATAGRIIRYVLSVSRVELEQALSEIEAKELLDLILDLHKSK